MYLQRCVCTSDYGQFNHNVPFRSVQSYHIERLTKSKTVVGIINGNLVSEHTTEEMCVINSENKEITNHLNKGRNNGFHDVNNNYPSVLMEEVEPPNWFRNVLESYWEIRK